MNKKALNSNKLNITICVPLKNPWIVLVLVFLGAHESDMLQQSQARKAAPSQGLIIYHSYNPSGTCSMAQKDYELIDKQMALWEEASAAFRQYEEAKGNVSPEQLELLRQKAEWLAAAASSYQLETMTSRKAPQHCPERLRITG